MEEIKSLKFWLWHAKRQLNNAVKEILDIETKSELKELYKLMSEIKENIEWAEVNIEKIENKLPF